VIPISERRLRIAAIRFLNPAPLMWDFEHPPLKDELASRYELAWMLPSECADRLATAEADIGLIPIATLAANPTLRILPGCVIASKGCVRSLLLVRRASQPLAAIRSVAADTASRTTVAHARLLFRHWGNPDVPFLPMAADIDTMLQKADAAIVIGDPALMAMEERVNRFERDEEELVYHDLAEEWRALTGLPFVSAVWATVPTIASIDMVAEDFIRSRDHGLQNREALADEWANKIPLTEQTIHTYLTSNIHYVLDEECVAGMNAFFKMAAAAGILPNYNPQIEGALRY
jgi:chorismate dehydratase